MRIEVNSYKDVDENIIPKPPTFLSKEAKDKYYQVARSKLEGGTWETGDSIALVALCSSYQRWIQAEKAIKKNKELCFETESGYRQQIPEVSIANNSMKLMLQYIKEFALTPRERIKLKSLFTEGDGDDEMDSMIVK